MQLLPENTYPAVVVPVKTESGPLSIQFGPGTDKSPFTAVLSFEILRGPFAGQVISAFLYFGEKSIDRSMDALRLCGFTGDDIDRFSDQTPENEVAIVVEHEEYEGKLRAKVRWINDPNRGAGYVLPKPLHANDLRKYSAQLKQRLKAVPIVTGKKAEREPPTAPPPAHDNGWHGNDAPVPPSAGEYARDTKVEASTDDIPF